jgi:hypothetical protein
MFKINILFDFINEIIISNKKQNIFKNNKIIVLSTDIEKSELPGKKQNESNINYCIRMINNGWLSFYNNYKLEYDDIILPEITKKIIVENKGSLKKITNDNYIYHSQNDKYFLIWCNPYGYGWDSIDINQTNLNFKLWDIENQITY